MQGVVPGVSDRLCRIDGCQVGVFRRIRTYRDAIDQDGLIDIQQYRKFASLSREQALAVPPWTDRFPLLHDATGNTPFDRHYIYHPAWAARKLVELGVTRHVDISSLLDYYLPERNYALIDKLNQALETKKLDPAVRVPR